MILKLKSWLISDIQQMPEEFKSGLYNIYDNCMDNIYIILMDINSQIEKVQNNIDQEIKKIDSLQLI